MESDKVEVTESTSIPVDATSEDVTAETDVNASVTEVASVEVNVVTDINNDSSPAKTTETTPIVATSAPSTTPAIGSTSPGLAPITSPDAAETSYTARRRGERATQSIAAEEITGLPTPGAVRTTPASVVGSKRVPSTHAFAQSASVSAILNNVRAAQKTNVLAGPSAASGASAEGLQVNTATLPSMGAAAQGRPLRRGSANDGGLPSLSPMLGQQ